MIVSDRPRPSGTPPSPGLEQKPARALWHPGGHVLDYGQPAMALPVALERPLRVTNWLSIAVLLGFGAWYGLHSWYHVRRQVQANLLITTHYAAQIADFDLQGLIRCAHQAKQGFATAPLASTSAGLEHSLATKGCLTVQWSHPAVKTRGQTPAGWIRIARKPGLAIAPPTYKRSLGKWVVSLRQTVTPQGRHRGLTLAATTPLAILTTLGQKTRFLKGLVFTSATTAVRTDRTSSVVVRQSLPHFPLAAVATAGTPLLWSLWWRQTRILFAFLILSIFATAWTHRRTLARQQTWGAEREAAARALAREKELAEITLQSIADAVIMTDIEGRVTSMNIAAERLTGYSHQEAVGLPIEQIFRTVDETTRDPSPNRVAHTLEDGKVSELTRDVLIAQHGTEYVIEHSAAPIRNLEQQIFGVVLVFHDVTDRHRLTAALIHQARHDYLTGLPNRQTLEDTLVRSCRGITGDTRHILLYMDLDQLKVINDSCGHAAGDDLLRQIAKILGMHVRASDVVARLGGDEFAVLLHRCDLGQGQIVAENLLHAIRRHRFIWQNKTFSLSASMGLVVLDLAMADPVSALSAADSACYLAKEQGRNRVCIYTSSDQAVSRYREGISWINEVTEALEHNRLRLYRQKIVATSDVTMIGEYEVLMRLVRANGDVIRPSLFIPSVERYGIMPNLDRWVLRRLLRHLDEQDAAGHAESSYQYAINISGTSLNDDFFLNFVLEHLKAIHVDRVRFEITETAAITNFPRAQHFIAQLRSKGCRFSLDDFGSGLSSFNYLRNLAIDAIKIDGSFIKNIATDPVSYAIVKSINQVAHDMGLKTVAEYVEDKRALEPLKTIGVDYMQGHTIHEPEPMNLI